MDKRLQKRMNRRDFLHLAGLAAGGLAAMRLGFAPARAASHEEIPHRVALAGASERHQSLPPNPILKKLGFSDTDRLLIVQADDIGMCQSNIAAFDDLAGLGLVSSGSVMAPGIWFPLAAHYARTHPQVDFGVHLTLTSEGDAVRWRPLSTVDPKSGLLDGSGYLHKSAKEVARRASPGAAMQEMEAQINRLKWMGIQLTHADAHLSAALQPVFIEDTIQLAGSYHLPVAFLRPDEALWKALPDIQEDWIPTLMDGSRQLEAKGLPLLDSISSPGLPNPEDSLALIKKIIGDLKPGVHLMKIHPARDTSELRALSSNWPACVADYVTWKSPELARFVDKSGVRIIGWAQIRALMPD